jgi:hypothetical protein
MRTCSTETLLIVSIIGLLAGYGGPKYSSQLGKAEVNVTQAKIKESR